MTTFGALMQGDVRRLLNDFGYDLTLRRTTEGAYDPATGQTGASSDNDETVRAVLVNYDNREVDGTEIQRGDRQALISAVDSTGASITQPQTNDKLIGEGDQATVVNARVVKSGSSVIGYICQVRL